MFQELKQRKEMDGMKANDVNTLVLKENMGCEISPLDVSRRTGTISVPRMASLPMVARSSLPVKVVAPALHEHLAEKAIVKSKAEVRQQKRKKRRETIANFFETLADSGETIIKTD